MRHKGRFGVIATVLVAGSSFAVQYAHRARMYAAMILVGVVCAWAADRWLTNRSDRAAAAASASLLFGLFLHSSAMFLAVGLFAVAGLDRRRPAWVWRAAVAVPVVVWAAVWGPAFVDQAGQTPPWIPKTSIGYLGTVLNELVSIQPATKWIGVTLIAVGGAALVFVRPHLGRLWLACFALPLAVVALLGLHEHVLLPRTLAFAAWAPLLGIAALVDLAIERMKVLGATLAIALALLLVPSALSAPGEYGDQEAEPAVDHLAAVAQPGDALAIRPYWLGPLLKWHLGGAGPGSSPTYSPVTDTSSLALDGAEPTGRIWVLQPTIYRQDDPGFRSCAPLWEAEEYDVLCLTAE